jgi:hypothetical protein
MHYSVDILPPQNVIEQVAALQVSFDELQRRSIFEITRANTHRQSVTWYKNDHRSQKSKEQSHAGASKILKRRFLTLKFGASRTDARFFRVPQYSNLSKTMTCMT